LLLRQPGQRSGQHPRRQAQGPGRDHRQRSELLPDLPAVAERFKGFQIDTWWGLVAPAGTPAEVVQRLNTQAVKALYSAEVMACTAT
jgi:tripartite-type tricarboxylate transporter receptor subunit TctC